MGSRFGPLSAAAGTVKATLYWVVVPATVAVAEVASKKMIPLQIQPLPEEVASKHPRPISTRR